MQKLTLICMLVWSLVLAGCPEPDDDDTGAAGDGVAECVGDCDDADASTYLGATESYDGTDNDCDGVLLTGEDTDADGDGYLACEDCDGTGANDAVGMQLVGTGDVDGDGYDDIMVGSTSNVDGGWNGGKTYVMYGPVTGSISLSAADVSFEPENAGDCAGIVSKNRGDIDGDGHHDLLIGAYGNNEGGSYAGAVYIFYAQ